MSKLKKGISIGLLSLVAVGFMAMSAQAQQGMGQGMKGGRNMPTFSDIDANGDGKVSEQELNEFRAERMSKMAAEGRQMKHAGDMPTFADIDTDGDGFINEQEFTAHQAERRAEMQKNRNSQ
jgi:hypothetical protein